MDLPLFRELRNDGLSETLKLRHEVNGKDFPCLYIKIGKFVINEHVCMSFNKPNIYIY